MTLPWVRIAFSYQTPVAFTEGGIWVTRKNQWGPTTAKHLADVDHRHKERAIPDDEWWERFSRALGMRVLANGKMVWR